jgi:hypothetical protein
LTWSFLQSLALYLYLKCCLLVLNHICFMFDSDNSDGSFCVWFCLLSFILAP